MNLQCNNASPLTAGSIQFSRMENSDLQDSFHAEFCYRELGWDDFYWDTRALGPLPRGNWFQPLESDPLAPGRFNGSPTLLQVLIHFMRVYRLHLHVRMPRACLLNRVCLNLGGDESLRRALAMIRYYCPVLLYREDAGHFVVEPKR